MRDVVLVTKEGWQVHEGKIPPYNPPPSVITWKSRTFHLDGTGKTLFYREVFAVPLPPGEPPQTWHGVCAHIQHELRGTRWEVSLEFQPRQTNLQIYLRHDSTLVYFLTESKDADEEELAPSPVRPDAIVCDVHDAAHEGPVDDFGSWLVAAEPEHVAIDEIGDRRDLLVNERTVATLSPCTSIHEAGRACGFCVRMRWHDTGEHTFVGANRRSQLARAVLNALFDHTTGRQP